MCPAGTCDPLQFMTQKVRMSFRSVIMACCLCTLERLQKNYSWPVASCSIIGALIRAMLHLTSRDQQAGKLKTHRVEGNMCQMAANMCKVLIRNCSQSLLAVLRATASCSTTTQNMHDDTMKSLAFLHVGLMLKPAQGALDS